MVCVALTRVTGKQIKQTEATGEAIGWVDDNDSDEDYSKSLPTEETARRDARVHPARHGQRRQRRADG